MAAANPHVDLARNWPVIRQCFTCFPYCSLLLGQISILDNNTRILPSCASCCRTYARFLSSKTRSSREAHDDLSRLRSVRPPKAPTEPPWLSQMKKKSLSFRARRKCTCSEAVPKVLHCLASMSCVSSSRFLALL